MAEFTGERVVPGEVSPDLWNEHFSRYAFAARLARGKRVLDMGSGSGYGTAELAKAAQAVTGVEISAEAVASASTQYAQPHVTFRQGSVTALEFEDQSFDLVTAFEVIEHLEEPRLLLEEARRVLSPTGQLMVSTPNKSYYAESRKTSGPNPFHVHEFEFEEFRELLESIFPSVRLFLQNHAGAITFQPCGSGSFAPAELALERRLATPEESNFFVAVCALVSQTGSPTYVYLPGTTNVLRERERHIVLLEEEVRNKSEWLAKSQADHAKLLELHERVTAELAERAEWAARVQSDIDEAKEKVSQFAAESSAIRAEAAAKIQRFEQELKQAREEAVAKIERLERERAETVERYERELTRVNDELRVTVEHWRKEAEAAEREAEAAHHAWVDLEEQFTQYRGSAEKELAGKVAELGRCVELLHAAEATVEERTRWAFDLQAHIEQLEQTIQAAQNSRWIRLGQKIGVGPDLRR